MNQRVFLHVGSPKTGTTFLQRVLWSQSQLAKSQGLLLPGRGMQDHFKAVLHVREVDHPHTGVTPQEGLWERLVEQVRQWPGTSLLSHELFAPATAEQAGRTVLAFSGIETHLVLTTRDLLRQLPAEWQETVKHRDTTGFEDYVRDVQSRSGRGTWFWAVQDAVDIIRRWTEHLPPDRVHLLTVPPPGTGSHTLWNRWAGLLGIEAEAFDLSSARTNPSLGAVQAGLLRKVNEALGERIPVSSSEFGPLKGEFSHQVLSASPGTPIAVPGHVVRWAVQRSQELVAQLRTLPIDVLGDLEELIPEPPDRPTGVDPDRVSESELLDVAVAALADLLDRFTSQHVRLKQQREESRTLQAELRMQAALLAEREAASPERSSGPVRRMLRRVPGGHRLTGS